MACICHKHKLSVKWDIIIYKSPFLIEAPLLKLCYEFRINRKSDGHNISCVSARKVYQSLQLNFNQTDAAYIYVKLYGKAINVNKCIISKWMKYVWSGGSCT